ncbi:hypothetical protein [Epilithonimonas sp. UC225_85]|uniref:hypothetical protein n=1 Tax=Epilithonimonas sp. UC225_85 TaxID=3350167 RepID=UPI0036D2E076
MEITIKDLQNNLKSLPSSLYGVVNEYLNLLREVANPEIPEWQKKEVRKRIEFAKIHPESLVDFDSFMNDFEKEHLNES